MTENDNETSSDKQLPNLVKLSPNVAHKTKSKINETSMTNF